LRDPLPVPFTAEEVRGALFDIYKHRAKREDRNCAPADPASVHIAIAVMRVLVQRNGGWIDFDIHRPPSEPATSRAQFPRTDVYDLQCLIYRLPGKPLTGAYVGMCRGEQPRRLEALWNVRDVTTTFDVTSLSGTSSGDRLESAVLHGTVSQQGARDQGSDMDSGGSGLGVPIAPLTVSQDSGPRPFSLVESHPIRGA